MDICPNFSLYVYKFVPGDTSVVSRLRCKSWQCPYCAAKNRQMWRKHLRKRINAMGGKWWFVTLTAHETTRTEAASLANLRSNLDRLFKRLRRIFERIDYVRVYEVHKTGAFHAHLVVCGLSARVQKIRTRGGFEAFRATNQARGKGNWSIRTWFRRTARQLQMGYMVDVSAMENTPQVVAYVTKYMSKAAQNFHVPGLRRIQASQRIGSPKEKSGGGWVVSRAVWGGDVGYGKLLDAQTKEVILPGYWLTHFTYPDDGKGNKLT